MTYSTIDNDVTVPGGEGALLAGRYRIVKQLGQGGMGSVWLAEDTQLDGKRFAIKMLPSILVSNKRAYRQLKDEALVAMKLTHPNIVTLRAFEDNNGNPFLVMDYIEGQTLDDYLAEAGNGEREAGNGRARTPGAPQPGGLPEEEVVRILKPIAAALDYAHEKGVVHRDVKPGNVMVAKDGTPYVLDFGIAREIQETMTRVTGKPSSGTLLYMSPEQLSGAAPNPAQDVYSFAAMAYECISGHPPFYRGAIEDQIKNDRPKPLGAHVLIGDLVAQGLSKNPESRPHACAAVLERDASLKGAGIGRAGNPTAAWSWMLSASKAGNSSWMKVFGLILLCIALVGGAWLLFRKGSSPVRDAGVETRGEILERGAAGREIEIPRVERTDATPAVKRPERTGQATAPAASVPAKQIPAGVPERDETQRRKAEREKLERAIKTLDEQIGVDEDFQREQRNMEHRRSELDKRIKKML